FFLNCDFFKLPSRFTLGASRFALSASRFRALLVFRNDSHFPSHSIVAVRYFRYSIVISVHFSVVSSILLFIFLFQWVLMAVGGHTATWNRLGSSQMSHLTHFLFYCSCEQPCLWVHFRSRDEPCSSHFLFEFIYLYRHKKDHRFRCFWKTCLVLPPLSSLLKWIGAD
ncbi:hypothetical protein PRIPAC_75700, partial [Pristionchus pacificus]|uniref:Uncharacterized protein n=1 Tax=Pristionchus pacificus TaxID=54126 RepID=A0A2A6CEQ9_PRIPA